MIKSAILTLLMAMVPVIELRGAIPFGVVNGLSIPAAFLISVVGNLIPIPFIILFVRRIFEFIRTKSKKLDKIVCKFEQKAEKNRATVERSEFWGLMLLVAIPLPGTGAWTGALVAAMIDMRLKRAMPSIILGVILAGIIVTVITYGAGTLIA